MSLRLRLFLCKLQSSSSRYLPRPRSNCKCRCPRQGKTRRKLYPNYCQQEQTLHKELVSGGKERTSCKRSEASRCVSAYSLTRYRVVSWPPVATSSSSKSSPKANMSSSLVALRLISSDRTSLTPLRTTSKSAYTSQARKTRIVLP